MTGDKRRPHLHGLYVVLGLPYQAHIQSVAELWMRPCLHSNKSSEVKPFLLPRLSSS